MTAAGYINAERRRDKLKKSGMGESVKLLILKNLEKEVHKYGYHWSWKSHVLLTAGALLGICAIGLVFQLRMEYLAVILIVTLFLLPVFVIDVFRKMFEQKRFSDAATYMEQMLYSFQKSGKILIALKETRELFEEGQMREVIQEAIWYVERGSAESEGGILREAFQLIENAYGCRKLYLVHELLVSSELYGGETEQSSMLLLEDLELWKRRGYQLQKEKKISHRDNIVSLVVATILSAVALYVLDAMKGMFPERSASFQIFQVTAIQWSSLLFILFSLFVFAKSTKSLTRNWLKEEGARDIGYILESYQMVMDYNEKKAKKKSLLWAAPFFAGAAASCILQNKWLAIVLLGVGCFLLMQYKAGYALAKKDLTEELYLAFPQWLMEIALLLQSNNVQMSIRKSVQQAPEVLKPELEKLMERLEEEPDQLTSYTDFCKNFDIPEAASCMKMLHAISEAGTGNAGIQVHELIKRVSEMQNMADEIKNRSVSFQMKMMFSYPVIAATVKLLIDLTVGMFYMFRMLGSLGGAL